MIQRHLKSVMTKLAADAGEQASPATPSKWGLPSIPGMPSIPSLPDIPDMSRARDALQGAVQSVREHPAFNPPNVPITLTTRGAAGDRLVQNTPALQAEVDRFNSMVPNYPKIPVTVTHTGGRYSPFSWRYGYKAMSPSRGVYNSSSDTIGLNADTIVQAEHPSPADDPYNLTNQTTRMILSHELGHNGAEHLYTMANDSSMFENYDNSGWDNDGLKALEFPSSAQGGIVASEVTSRGGRRFHDGEPISSYPWLYGYDTDKYTLAHSVTPEYYAQNSGTRPWGIMPKVLDDTAPVESRTYISSLSDSAAEDRRHSIDTTFVSNPDMDPDELALEMRQNYDRANEQLCGYQPTTPYQNPDLPLGPDLSSLMEQRSYPETMADIGLYPSNEDTSFDLWRRISPAQRTLMLRGDSGIGRTGYAFNRARMQYMDPETRARMDQNTEALRQRLAPYAEATPTGRYEGSIIEDRRPNLNPRYWDVINRWGITPDMRTESLHNLMPLDHQQRLLKELDRADRVREMEDSPYSPFSLPSSQKWS